MLVDKIAWLKEGRQLSSLKSIQSHFCCSLTIIDSNGYAETEDKRSLSTKMFINLAFLVTNFVVLLRNLRLKDLPKKPFQSA